MTTKFKIWRRLGRNTLSNLVGVIVPMAVGFFLMPFVVRHIGATAFGIWLLAGSVIGYMGLISLGLGPTVTKKSAEYLALKNTAGLNHMLSTVYVLYLGLGAVLAIAVLALAPVIPLVFHTDAQDVEQLKWVFWLVGLQAALGFPFAIFGGLIQGLHDFHISNGIVVINSVFRLIGTVILLSMGRGLISLLVLEFFLSFVGWALQFAWAKKRIPSLRIQFSWYDPKQIREIIGFSGAMFLWRVAGLTVHRSSRIIIGLFMPLSNITTYEVGNRIIDYSRTAFTSFLNPLLPLSSELQAQAITGSLREIYLRGTKIVLAVYLAATTALYLWGESFIRLWMGHEFVPAALLLQILLIGNVYQAQNVVAHVMLPGMGYLRVFSRIMAAYPIVSVLLSLLLIYPFGLVGVAVAGSATFIILETYFLRQILPVFRMSLAELLRRCHLPSMMALLPALMFGVVSRVFLPVNTWTELVMVISVFLAIHAGAFWLWGLSRSEKDALRTLWNAFLKRKNGYDQIDPNFDSE